jgi:hypothetical protein
LQLSPSKLIGQDLGQLFGESFAASLLADLDNKLASQLSVHKVAEQLVKLVEGGMQRQAVAGLIELNVMRNHLISVIHKLAEQSEATVQ